MKKISVIVFSAYLCLLLTACGKEPQSSEYSQIGEGVSSQQVSSSESNGEASSESSGEASSESSSEASSEASSQAGNESHASSNESSASSSGGYVPSDISRDPTAAGYGYVSQSARASASYFDDAVFIGDSVSLKLSYYCSSSGALGNAKFLTSGSLGSGNALWDISDESVHPTYQGAKIRIEDGVAAIGAKKVYIMLGMNDIGLYGIDDALVNYQTLVSLILEKSPSAQIFVQSMTPMLASSNILGRSLNNEKIAEYNSRLLGLCEANNWYFIDVASVMHDSDGYLIYEYCSDPDTMGIHFTSAGCEAWVDYLYTHTP